jgi:uncharacterized protein (TIGR01777 family)
MRVFITGGTGLIGTRLVRQLRLRQDQPVVLSRRPEAAQQFGSEAEVVQGDPTQAGPWQDRAAECDAIINLAGEGIFNKRWSTEFKQKLRDSRVKSTENCAAAIGMNARRADGSPKLLINASAIGIYGPHGDEELDESTPAGDDFLARVCVEWEEAARAVVAKGVRLVIARMGVVLDKNGGALKKLLTPFKFGMGGPVGSGKQYTAWVHHADVVGLLVFALDTPAASGPMNVTAPGPVTNKEFGKAIGRALGRPAFVWTPGIVLKLGLGGVSEVVLSGQRVLPRKALEWGYAFQFPQIDAALADILR